jgi:hypothetical protein
MRRQAFTLVEMMVSLTLVLFIMVLLSQAFQAGLESFRLLKGVGDMEERLRSVTTILRRDLAADHFEGRRRISDDSFWTLGPPREGFFRVWHGTPYSTQPGDPNVIEASPPQDPDQIGSSRATDHMLHFSVKLRGNRRQDFVSASVPESVKTDAGNMTLSPLLTQSTNFFNQSPDSRYQEGPSGGYFDYNSQWFEVVYYLRQIGTTLLPDSPSGGPGTPLFALVRRQLVVVPDNSHLNWGTPIKVFKADDLRQYAEMSCKKATLNLNPLPFLYPTQGDPLYFNNPTDLTVPPRRFGMLPLLSNNQITGQRERAGLPTVPLLDPNDLSVSATSNRGRYYPMLGEMLYQKKKYGNVPPGQWPPWLRNWFTSGGIFSDPFTNLGLPVTWHDNPVLQGADVLLSDVVSFEVKVLLPGANEFIDLFDPRVPTNNPIFRGNNSPRVFDTWSSVKDDTYDYSNWSSPNSPVSVPSQIRILALQIALRVWDRKTQQTRQITLVQEM